MLSVAHLQFLRFTGELVEDSLTLAVDLRFISHHVFHPERPACAGCGYRRPLRRDRHPELKDFPDAALAPYAIEAQHPDEFLCNHLSLAPGVVCSAVRKVRARLLKPPYSVAEYLATLTRQGLVATAGELQSFADLL